MGIRDTFVNWRGRIFGNVEKASSIHPAMLPSPRGFGNSPSEYKAVVPTYNPEEIDNIANTTPLLRGIFYTIQREMFDTGVSIVPLFDKICRKCRIEYEENETSCTNDLCVNKGEKLEEPKLSDKAKVQAIMRSANPDHDGNTVLKSILQSDLGQSNYYISVSFKALRRYTGAKLVPYSMYHEDPVLMRIVADELGHIGDPNQLICIACSDNVVYTSDKKKAKVTLTRNGLKKGKNEVLSLLTKKQLFTKAYDGNEVVDGKACPKCRAKLYPTAFVKLLKRGSNEIQARFSKKDMVHGSSNLQPPNYYGISNIVVAWKLVETVDAMDDFNRQTYAGKHLGAIVNWKGMEQDEVNTIIKKAQQQGNNTLEYDAFSKQYTASKGQSQVHLASTEAGIQYISILDDFTKLQSLEFYNKYGDIFGMLYGVPPAYMNWAQQGGGSKDPSMQKDIILGGIRERMDWMTNEFNYRVLFLMGIKDYGIRFGSVSTKEDHRKLQSEHTKMTVRKLALDARVEGDFNDENIFIITGKIEPEPVPEQLSEFPKEESGQATNARNKRTKISDSSDQLVEG